MIEPVTVTVNLHPEAYHTVRDATQWEETSRDDVINRACHLYHLAAGMQPREVLTRDGDVVRTTSGFRRTDWVGGVAVMAGLFWLGLIVGWLLWGPTW